VHTVCKQQRIVDVGFEMKVKCWNSSENWRFGTKIEED
jgi:hypothetical protein